MLLGGGKMRKFYNCFSLKMRKSFNWPQPASSNLTEAQLTRRGIFKMKTLFAIVLLAVVVLSSEAAPSHGVQLYKNDLKMLVLTEAGNGKLHDIWSICSKTKS